MLKRENIRIRDPFIYTDHENKCYYMYGTTALEPDSIAAKNTFSVYRSVDLENFEEPKVIFDGDKCGFGLTEIFGRPNYINIMANFIFSVAARQMENIAQRMFLFAIRRMVNLCR